MMRIAAGLPLMLAAALAQQPSFENARMETRPAGASLESTMRAFIAAQSAPAWIGYSVPIVPGERHVCGWDKSSQSQDRMSLEGPAALSSWYRTERAEVSHQSSRRLA